MISYNREMNHDCQNKAFYYFFGITDRYKFVCLCIQFLRKGEKEIIVHNLT